MAKLPPDKPVARSISLERLALLLDAYGARPERWPDDERETAQALIDRSPAAHAMWTEAAGVDQALGALAIEPTPELTARVLATAPRPSRRYWRRAAVAALPLAAAALLALWIAARPPRVDRAASTPVMVGVYFSPTDVLLEPIAVGVFDAGPSIHIEELPDPQSEEIMRRPLG